MKKLPAFLICVFVIIYSLVLTGCSVFDSKYEAIYLTSNENSILNDDDLKGKKVMKVNSFSELEQEVKKFDYKVPILIDKNALNEKNKDGLNKWIPAQKTYPIIFVGYGNPTYIYIKELNLYAKKHIPNYSEEQFEMLKKQKGFSLMYISESGQNFGIGFLQENTLKNILKITDKALKGEKEVLALMPKN